MVQCFWESTYVHRRPVFYSLEAGFFFIGNFCFSILTITLSRIKVKKIFVPILTKLSQGVKVYITKKIRSGSYEKEERY